MTAGLFGAAWLRLRELYRSGRRRSFDVVAVHVYTRKEANVLETVRRVNREMKRSRDRGNRVWVTEVSFPASKGRAQADRRPGPGDPGGDGAQAVPHLPAAGPRSESAQRLDRVYWYTWASSYEKQQPSNFDFAGLLRARAPSATGPSPRWTPSGG